MDDDYVRCEEDYITNHKMTNPLDYHLFGELGIVTTSIPVNYYPLTIPRMNYLSPWINHERIWNWSTGFNAGAFSSQHVSENLNFYSVQWIVLLTSTIYHSLYVSIK